MLDLEELLRLAVDRDASDVHVKAGSPPHVRVGGVLEPTPYDPVEPADTERLARSILPDGLAVDLEACRELDFAHSVPGLGRFRVSVFRQRGSLGLALRRVAVGIPSLEALGLPPVVADLADAESGLVLVVGPARSGRTTTLAAMVDQINRTRRKHVVTIEDPVEVLHRDELSIVSQREVGTDTESCATALRRAARQDPDVIAVGMVDDDETAQAALSAAGAGQLVLAGMPTLSPATTIKALVDHFPAHLEDHARTMLAVALRGVVSQRLLARPDGSGRALAAEVLVATPPVIDAVGRGDEMAVCDQAIASGDYWGMQSLDDSLLALFAAGLVTKRDVIANASAPSDVRIEVERIEVSGRRAASEPLLNDRQERWSA